MAAVAETEKTGFVTSVPAAGPSVCVLGRRRKPLSESTRDKARRGSSKGGCINNAVDSGEVKRKAGDAFSFAGLERTGGGLGQVPGWLGDQVSDS